MKRTDKDLIAEAYKPIFEMAFGVAEDPSVQKSITQEQLKDLIIQTEQNRPGTNFISVTQVTKETTNKAPYPPFVLPGLKGGKTYFAKVTQINGEIGSNYGDKMRRQQTAQGMTPDFVTQKSAYEEVEGSVSLRQKDGQFYIQYFPRSISKKSAPILVKATKDNPASSGDFVVTNRADVAQYKGPPRAPQQIEVTTRTVSLASIAAIKINKNEYVISDLDPIRKAIWEISGAPMPDEITTNAEPAEAAKAPSTQPDLIDQLNQKRETQEDRHIHDVEGGEAW